MTKAAWLPDGFEIRGAYDVQAMANGNASPEQQKAALRFIVENLSGAYGLTFDAKSERQDCYNQGRRHVGLSIIQITKLNLEKVKRTLEPQPKEPK